MDGIAYALKLARSGSEELPLPVFLQNFMSEIETDTRFCDADGDTSYAIINPLILEGFWEKSGLLEAHPRLFALRGVPISLSFEKRKLFFETLLRHMPWEMTRHITRRQWEVLDGHGLLEYVSVDSDEQWEYAKWR